MQSRYRAHTHTHASQLCSLGPKFNRKAIRSCLVRIRIINTSNAWRAVQATLLLLLLISIWAYFSLNFFPLNLLNIDILLWLLIPHTLSFFFFFVRKTTSSAVCVRVVCTGFFSVAPLRVACGAASSFSPLFTKQQHHTQCVTQIIINNGKQHSNFSRLALAHTPNTHTHTFAHRAAIPDDSEIQKTSQQAKLPFTTIWKIRKNKKINRRNTVHCTNKTNLSNIHPTARTRTNE